MGFMRGITRSQVLVSTVFDGIDDQVNVGVDSLQVDNLSETMRVPESTECWRSV